MAYENALSDLLLAIDKNDLGLYQRLKKSQKEELTKKIWLMMRYCSAVDGNADGHYLEWTNELVNVDYMKLMDHPELQWKMMSICGIGKRQNHYLPSSTRGKKESQNAVLSEVFPQLNTDELKIMVDINDRTELLEWCTLHGYEEKDIVKCFKG